MDRTPAEIKRPKLLGALAAATALSAAGACMSLLNMSYEERAEPVLIRAGAERLEAALAGAPAARLGDNPGEAAPVVWAVTAPNCAACAGFAERDIGALRREGFDVRLVWLGPDRPAARAAVARVVRENGAELRLPALFWRSGGAWRGALGRDPDARERLRADLAPQA